MFHDLKICYYGFVCYRHIMALFEHYPILIPFIAILAAEVAKFSIDLFQHRSKRRFLNSGGMPSGHSAFVSSLVVVVASREGIESTAFMIASVLAIVVMYDAIHVRNEAGKHATLLNKKFSTELEESLGHTHWEVLAGALFGGVVAWGLVLL